jgi:hypothetical protein
MTRVNLTVRGMVVPLDVPKPWDEVVEILNRHFAPGEPRTGPILPPLEQPKGRARR